MTNIHHKPDISHMPPSIQPPFAPPIMSIMSTPFVDLSELPLGVLQQFHPKIDKDVYECLSLRGSLNARNTLGGTAPAQVRAQIARHRARLG